MSRTVRYTANNHLYQEHFNMRMLDEHRANISNKKYSDRRQVQVIYPLDIALLSCPFQGTVLTGLAGDRRVVLLIDGDKWSQGRPVLEVIDTKSKTKPNIERIVYKELK